MKTTAEIIKKLENELEQAKEFRAERVAHNGGWYPTDDTAVDIYDGILRWIKGETDDIVSDDLRRKYEESRRNANGTKDK